jgi:hypothetical protein
MNEIQIKSTDNMIDYHGLEKVINFYLDCILESKRINQHWINALIYCSKQL